MSGHKVTIEIADRSTAHAIAAVLEEVVLLARFGQFEQLDPAFELADAGAVLVQLVPVIAPEPSPLK